MPAISGRLTASILLFMASAAISQGQTAPPLTVTPSSITFSYPVGQTATPVSATVEVTAPGSSATNFTVSLEPPSLSQYISFPASGQTGSSLTLRLDKPYFSNPVNGTLYLTPAPGSGFAQTSVPILIRPGGSSSTTLATSPAALSFNYSVGTTTPVTRDLDISAPSTVQLGATLSSNLQGYFTVPPYITSNSRIQVTLSYPNLVASGTSGTLTLTPLSGSGLTAVQVPISVNASGTSNIVASPPSINFVYPVGTTAAVTQQVNLTAPATTGLTPTLSSNLAGSISISGSLASNSQILVTLVNPYSYNSITQGSLVLTPPVGSTLTPLTIPITINPGGTGTGSGLSVSPAAATFTYSAGTTSPISQTLQLTAPVTANVTTSISSNVAGNFSLPTTVTSNSSLTLTLMYPYLTPSGTYYLTLTPTPGSGLAQVQIPIYINTSGGGTGTVVATPATLTFNTQVNSTETPAAQNVTLTSAGVEFVTATASSTNSFLSVSQSSFATPTTLVVRVDPTRFTTAGTYNGTIQVVSNTGVTAATINVTVNVAANVTVTPAPASVSLSAAAGSTTPAQAQVQLTSTDSTVAFNATTTTTPAGGTWLSVNPATGSLGSGITISANASGLTTGSYTGNVVIASQGTTLATIPVTFSVTPAASIQVTPATLSFAHQTTSTSAPVAQTVQVASSTTGAALNFSATATSSGNWLQVTPATGSTPGTLTITVVPTGLTPGTYTGQVAIASAGATNSPQNVSVTLTVTTPAIPLLSSVVNSASFAPTVAVPGEIVTIRGTDLGPATGVAGTVDASGFLSTTVSGVRVLFDGTAAPILYASSTQINAVVPFEIANRVSTKLQVQAQSQTSRELELRVGETAPGIYTTNGSGSGQAAALNQNSSVNSATNPEARGNVIVLYATGGGQTSPAGTTGQVSGSSPRLPIASVIVRIGGQPAQVLYAGSAQGLISGALQINARIPQNVAAGSLPVEVQIGGATSQTQVTIAVQ